MNAPSPAWDTLWDEARAVDIVEVAGRLGAKLRRIGSDHAGHCPAGCTRHGDGFVVTPKKGIFLCRPSGATGDAVDLCQHVLNRSKTEALEFVTGRVRPDRTHDETPEQLAAREDAMRKREADAEALRRDEDSAAAAKRRRDEEAVAEVLRRAVPIAGTHAEAYLRARGLTPAKRLTGDLRFVADLDYWGFRAESDKEVVHLATIPAMIAIIRDVAGERIGVSQIFMDPREPKAWAPIGDAKRNGPKKIRGRHKGGMIRLGMLGECVGVAEGVANALSWLAQGLGPEDVSIAAAVSLGNLAGACTGSIDHPTLKGPDGRPTKIRNGIPDMARPGMILPPSVQQLIIVKDGDSERVATNAAVLAAARRAIAEGREVYVSDPGDGVDWNDVLRAQMADMARERAA